MRTLRRGVAATALACLTVATGCGSSNNSASSSPASVVPSPAQDTSLSAQLPAKIKSKGSLTVATDASYAPNEFIDTNGKTVIGMDADLAKALAQVLGIKANVLNVNFPAIIPGLASGKYDVGLSSFTDTKEREKTVDFVTYFSSGTAFYTKASGGTDVNTLADLCGKTVAVEQGTTQLTDSTGQDKKCKAEGKPGVAVQVYPDQNGANLALSSGRAQLGMADSPVAHYQVKLSNGQFKITGQTYGTAPYGIAVPKSSGLAQPMLAALKKLTADGTYRRILDKWSVSSGAIDNPMINGAVR